MFFFIDESGNTGNNLFDETQPVLYYGLISSPRNLDVVAQPEILKLRAALGVARLHANEIGIPKLDQVVEPFIRLQKKHDIRFYFYKVVKADHAALSFADQVFDSGINEAVPGSCYWTPMRYYLFSKLSVLFDQETLEKAWAARIERNDQVSQKSLIEVCQTLLERVEVITDVRACELITGALQWAKRYPDKINYNTKAKQDALQVSPNLIGFQFVMQGMASRTAASRTVARKIIVDQQSQFNGSQQFLAEHYRQFRTVKLKTGMGMPDLDFSGTPDVPLTFSSSSQSYGLEIVDTLLWVAKRADEGKPLTESLNELMRFQSLRGRQDELSFAGLQRRWVPWFKALPKPTAEAEEKAAALIRLEEERRLQALQPGGANSNNEGI